QAASPPQSHQETVAVSLAPPSLPATDTLSLSEATVLGLHRQGVRTYLVVLGHGSTDLAEVLRVYATAGAVTVLAVRHETEASHAATALRLTTGEKAAVVTSIGPGALQALAGSLSAASNCCGVWYLCGDETTEDEGPNLQQVPGTAQHPYLRLMSALGPAYVLHTPQAVGTALRRGLNVVDHPHQAGPFYLLLPINTQPALLTDFNLRELPAGAPPPLGPAADLGGYAAAGAVLRAARRVVVRVGRGALGAGPELLDFLGLAGAVAMIAPAAQGIPPHHHERNMTVGGSKGSISGNYAMENADTLVAIGSRAVCQADCSRTGYPQVRQVININADADAATHYADTIALVGEAGATLRVLNQRLRGGVGKAVADRSAWLTECASQRRRWEEYKRGVLATPVLFDAARNRDLLTAPAAIAAIVAWAKPQDDLVTYWDAGDVQAYGFQLNVDDGPGRTVTETGASYMGFAPSAVLATAFSERDFYALAVCGDGSFTMAPQVLIDGAEHGARGCIVILDNSRMGAISGLQKAQYGQDFATSSTVSIDFAGWARSVRGVRAMTVGASADELIAALDEAKAQAGLSVVHVPVYYGDDPAGSLGTFGAWNVGSWVTEVQRERHRIGL
ncbi:MAG: thiamine pyrophosphate-dependent enzyme, partial [Streptosporangiaceae bacterium]